MTSPASAGRVAIAALFLSLGAYPDEIDPAFAILRRHDIPEDLGAIAQQAKDALSLVRMDRI